MTSMKRRAVLLGTGVGPNRIRFEAMPKGAEKKVKLDAERQIFDANGRRLEIAGKVVLLVRVGGCRVKAEFLLYRSLLRPVLIGTAFAKQNVRAILPMDRQLQMKNRDEVPILESITNDDIVKDRAKWKMYEVVTGPLSKISDAKFAQLAPQSQTWVEITIEVEGTYVLEPRAKYLSSIGLVMTNVIIALKPAVKEKVLIASLRQTPTDFNKGTLIAYAVKQPGQR